MPSYVAELSHNRKRFNATTMLAVNHPEPRAGLSGGPGASIQISGMTYSSSFVFRVYDKNGDYVSGSEVTGTIIAKRITVN